MDCPKCQKEYDYLTTIPLACHCGLTLCKSCITQESQNEVFFCPDCKALTRVENLWLNRGLDTIIKEIKTLKQTPKEPKKTKIYKSANLLITNINSETPYEKLENSDNVLVDEKEIQAQTEKETKKSQTGNNFVILEKINKKKLCFEIK